jgi:glycosyltransferase involved in cell wall biosynthesis
MIGIPEDAKVVLYCGHVSQGKGVGTLLEAWAKFAPSQERALLMIVGAPSPADDPNLSGRFLDADPATVRLYPMQNGVIPFLHAADLIVAPSMLDEGFGRVVIEAMSTSRPVVASRVGAVPEILSGEMSRFLVDARDSVSLRERIL